MNDDIKLIITDFDGPLNDLLAGKEKTIQQLFVKFGLPKSVTVVPHFLNLIDQYYIHDHILDYQELVSKCLARLKIDNHLSYSAEDIADFSKEFAEKLFENLTPNTFVLSILADIKSQYPQMKICIYTNQHTSYIVQYFRDKMLDLSVYEKVYGSEQFTERKPSTQNLIHICSQQGVLCTETVMIGDDPTLDLLPAHLLGMRTLLFNSVVGGQLKSIKDVQSLL